MHDVRIDFNWTYEYILPTYADPEGSNVTIHLYSTPKTNINDFVTIQSDRLIINPTSWLYLTTYNVIISLSDSQVATNYTWNLIIYNTSP
jgi:hypothetical protein